MDEASLQARAQAGDPDAQFALAQLFLQGAGAEKAPALLLAAARAGHVGAQYDLGKRLIAGDVAPLRPADGVLMLDAAAKAGHGAALAHLAVFHARGIDRAQDWARALALLGAAAGAGDARAQRQQALLGAGFDALAWIGAPRARMQFEHPRVGVVENFLPLEICAWLIERAKEDLKPSQTADPATGEHQFDPRRTNMFSLFWLLRLDFIVSLVKARIAATLAVSVAQQEIAQVFRYEPGQKFDIHVDFMDPDSPGFAQDLEARGQRLATFLIYLNDDFDGGETDFPELGWRFKGRAGDALLFWNVDRAGAVERRLAHAGLPPTRGSKWLFSQWVRSKPVALI